MRKIGSLPESLSQLSALQFIAFNYNSLEGVEYSIVRNPTLTDIDVLVGFIPSQLYQNSCVQDMLMSGNHFNGEVNLSGVSFHT